MSNIAKLKKQAAEFEQKRQFDKALGKYRQILDEAGGELDEADVAIYNRVGDLLLRQGNVSEAVGYYERAVDQYADSGFFSNAIALCNKILRTAPGRSIIYYKLGRISARKGFISDAKQNFLEYADRMRKSGSIDEAFRALKEFADLCPDQEDIRVMLADQLARDDRRDEAVEQLQMVHDKLLSEGRATEANATIDRIRTIDPERKLPAAGRLTPPGEGAQIPSGRRRTPELRYTPHGSSMVVDLAGLPLIHPEPLGEPEPLDGIEHGAAMQESELPPADAIQVPGLETGFYEDSAAPAEVEPLIDLEATSHDESLDSGDLEPAIETEPDSPSLLPDELDESAPGLDIPLIMPFEPSADAALVEGRVPDDSLPELEPIEDEDLVLSATDESWELETVPADDLPFIEDQEPEEESEFAAAAQEAPAPAEIVAPHAEIAAPPTVAERIAELRGQLERDPSRWSLRRALGELLLEDGNRAEGMAELEKAMLDMEAAGALTEALAMANEILHVDPDAVRFHQKRVELAFRSGDKGRLADAYLGLADCLVRAGELAKARVVYQRVLDLSPDDPRPRVAIDTITDPSRSNTPLAPDAIRDADPANRISRRATPIPPAAHSRPASTAPLAPPASPAAASGGSVRASSRKTPLATEFVDLSEWMDEEVPKSTRMIAEGVTEPESEEQADFAEMLERFKQGVAANVDEGDFQSHYDLGIAYREMGLLDEAIAEFQKALRATTDRVQTYEALGQCFLEKEQYAIAVTLLNRALSDGRHADDRLIGVLYLLGSSLEAMGRHSEARANFERVFAVDIRFRDIGERLAAVERAAS